MLLTAIKPALILNSLLFASLLFLDHFIHTSMKTTPLIYMLSMSVTGAVIYILLFLFLPLFRLRDEQMSWKRKLGLHPQLQPK
jgi:hypothetical protein